MQKIIASVLIVLTLSLIIAAQAPKVTVIKAGRLIDTVNGKVLNIPSFQLKVGDVIAVRDRESSRSLARNNHYEGAAVPAYMDADVQNYSGKVIALPEREDFPKFFQEQQVVEFYAR